MLLISGFGILVVRALLLLGNQTYVVPTMPFADLVIIATGGLIIGLLFGRRFEPLRQLAATRAP